MVQWLRLCAPNAGVRVRSLVRGLDPTRMPQLRVHMPQLRSLPAATKTWCSQIKKQEQKQKPRATRWFKFCNVTLPCSYIFPVPYTSSLMWRRWWCSKAIGSRTERAQSRWPVKPGWPASRCHLFTCVICSFWKHLLLRGYEEKENTKGSILGGELLEIHAKVYCLKTDNTFKIFLKTKTIFSWFQKIWKIQKVLSKKIVRTHLSIVKG